MKDMTLKLSAKKKRSKIRAEMAEKLKVKENRTETQFLGPPDSSAMALQRHAILALVFSFSSPCYKRIIKTFYFPVNYFILNSHVML